MLRGIDVGEIKNTSKEYVLLKTLKQEESLKGLEVAMIYRASLLDKSDTQAVSDYNDLLGKYLEAKTPGLEKAKEADVVSMSDQLKSLEDLSMEDLNITSKHGDTLDGKIKPM